MQITPVKKWKPVLKVAVATLPLLLTACAANRAKSSAQNPYISKACASNVFLQKYGCSLDRVEQAAESGDPDAQYALGYMYYYGIGTVRDTSTARLWVGRAAAQGQPLAQKALKLMQSGADLGSMHPSSRAYHGNKPEAPVSVKKLNAAVPDKPMSEHLPAYGNKSQPADHATPAAKVAPAKPQYKEVKPLQKDETKPPMSHKKTNDPRLAKGAKPTSQQAGRYALSAAEQQLMTIQSRYYTIQLMGSHNVIAVKRFVKRHHLAKETTYYSTNFQGEKWYILIYGQYSSVMQAHTATKNLPKSLRALHPWVKSYRVVQKEITTRKLVS